MGTSPRTFKKSSVTYGEMIEVLEQLGYHQKFDGKHNRYINEEHNSIVVLPIRPPQEMYEKVYLENDSYLLYMQGVIEKEDPERSVLITSVLTKNPIRSSVSRRVRFAIGVPRTMSS